MKILKKKIKAFSLAEILLSMSIFILISAAVIFGSFDSNRINKNNNLKITSSLYFEEYFNAIMDSKNSLWASLVNNTNAGPKSLTYLNERYQIVDGATSKDGINLSFTVLDVYRDINGNIVDSGSGTIDSRSRKIHITGSWTNIYGASQEYSSDIYVNDWNTLELKESTTAQFSDGTHTETILTTKVDGEVQLGYIIFPDWCKPTIALNEYDLPGSAVSRTVFGIPGKAYLGVEGASATNALTKLNISGVDNPTIQVEGTFSGYNVNNIFVSGNYAYLATTHDTKEVVILDITSYPYVEVGYFDATGTANGNSVYIVGNVGYVAAGRKVQTFDVTTKTGSRTKLGEVTMVQYPNWGKTTVAAVSQIVVRNNYIYGSLYEDYYELAIANATDPASMSVTSLTSVNNQQTLDIAVSSDGTRTYFGTNNSSSEREFFILDTTSKSGSRSTIGRYDTNGMSIQGIAIIEADHRAVLVGTGAEEYQAVNITTEASPVKCGGWQQDLGIYDIDAVTDAQGNAFSYLVTGDSSKDFKILRGGPGGGNEEGTGFPPSGNYVSSIINSESTNPIYYTVRWSGTVPSGTSLRLQLRTGTSPADIASQQFIGPDGSSSTYFTSQDASILPAVLNGKQYIQYKIYFDSDTISTPVLNDIIINYQK